jgi:hypothetical protein
MVLCFKIWIGKTNIYIFEILNECDYNIINNCINTLEQTNNYIIASWLQNFGQSYI